MTPGEFNAIRRQLGLNVKELAAKLQVDQVTVYRYESEDPKMRRRVPGPVRVILEQLLKEQQASLIANANDPVTD